MPFYDELAAMAADLLKPDTAGGLGMGSIQIVRLTPGIPNPAKPWEPVPPTETVATVSQIKTQNAEYVDRGTIIKTDMYFMTMPPQWGLGPVMPGDVVRIGGSQVGTVVHSAPFGSNDVAIYVEIWVNR